MSHNTSGIIVGPKDDYNLPEKPFGEIIFDCLKQRNSSKIISVDGVTKEVLTCGKLLNDSIKLSKILNNFGIAKGDVITIISENCLNYFVPVLAAFYIGATVNPLNNFYSVGELKHALLISKPKLIFSSASALENVVTVKRDLKLKKTVLLMERESTNNFDIKSFEELLDTTLITIENFKPVKFDHTQVALLIQSSGTTGLPKGVIITHQNLRIAIGCLSHPNYGSITSADTTIIVIPFFHIYGQILQIVSTITAMKSVIMAKFKPDTFLKCIQEHQVTTLFTVPPLLLFLIKSPLVCDYDISSVINIFVGAAPLGKELKIEALKRLGNVTIREMYGMTETSGPTIMQSKKSTDIGCVGSLVPGVIAKVWNPDAKTNMGCLETGELCFKGPMVMKSYIPIQKCIDDDGFLHSGDIGYYDQEGRFYIVGRIKELIKYKGFQVAPAELEALIINNPFVEDCGVIGIPDEKAGEIPLALIVLKPSSSVSEQDIVDFVAERISIQKHLYGGVKFIKEIPRTSSGKIIRRKLIEIYNQISTL